MIQAFNAHRLRLRRKTRQAGSAAPMLLLLVGASMAIAAFAVDGARVKTDAAQLKRATDAAALAVAQAAARSPDANVQKIAEDYIGANLGMDSEALQNQLHVSLQSVAQDDAKGYRVTAAFVPVAGLLGGVDTTVQVSSAAVARYSPMEVALTIPVDVTVSAQELTSLKKLSKDFLDRLFDNQNGSDAYDQSKDVWASLVPYSQSVNVYDANDTGRLQRWTTARARSPVELISLFRSGKANNLADPRIPDRKANLLCVYRGLGTGQNFFWDQPPSANFNIYYRHDLPENGSPGATPISWFGPNPDFGQASGVEDTRWMVADRGCPNAALLPLTADREKLFKRIDDMTIRFNVNYAIAMSWAAASLSPQMRGTAGWGDAKLPLDFNDDGRQANQKAIVMLGKVAGNWMDTDSYNFDKNENLGGRGTDGARAFSRQRFIDLCRSFQARKLRFYLIGVQPGNPKDIANTNFGNQAVPGMTICAADNGKLSFFDSDDIRSVSANIAARLNDIADELKRDASFVRLIE